MSCFLYRCSIRSHTFIKWLLLLVLPILFSTTAIGQKMNVDSLQKVIATTTNDSIRIMTMRNLAKYYLLHELKEKEGFDWLDKAETEARSKKFYVGISSVLLLRANYAFQHNQLGQGIAYSKEQISMAANIEDSVTRKRTLMTAYGNMAGIFSNNGDYTTAIDYYLRSLFIMESMEKDPTAICVLYVNITYMYNLTEQYALAEKYLAIAHPYLPYARPDLHTNFWSEKITLAKAKKDAGAIRACIDSVEKVLATIKFSKKQEIDARSLLLEMKADYISTYQKDYAGAIKIFEQRIVLEKEMGSIPGQYACMKSIGELYFKMGDYAKAAGILEDTYQLSTRDSVMGTAFSTAKLLSEVYDKTNDKAKAYNYLLKAYELNEQQSSEKKLKSLTFLEANYQGEKKEKEITALTLSNTQKELAVVKRNRFLVIGGVAAVTIMVLLGLMYRNTKNKQIIAEKEHKIKTDQVKFLERQQQVISLQSMVNGQETERTRIAKDLHDGLGGLFSTVKMYFSTLQHEQASLKGNELFGKSYELIDTASEEVRRIAHNMMPEVLMKLGLIPAIQDMCSNISAGKLIQVKLQSYGMESRLNASTEIMLYRIIQELLNNIIKHAKATEAIVQFNRDGNRLMVTVEDNGRGFNLQEVDDKNHIGLETIKSRVSYLNGNISIDSQQEVGTTVMMEFLLNETA